MAATAAAAAAQLEANPSGCTEFEPNVFRRERCLHCGHPWRLHLGAISDGRLAEFARQQAQAAGAQSAREAAAKAKAKAKVQARRRREWLFDAFQSPVASDYASAESDDSDMGFRMLTSRELDAVGRNNATATALAPAAPVRRLVVRNLIDFSECDVAENRPRSRAPSPPPPSLQPQPQPQPQSRCWMPWREAATTTTPTMSSSSAAAAAAPSALDAGARAPGPAPAAPPSSLSSSPSAPASSCVPSLRPSGASGAKAAAAAALWRGASSASTTSASASASCSTSNYNSPSSWLAPSSAAGADPLDEASLLDEVSYLRQRLKDAEEERRIQISELQEELEKKQREVDVLTWHDPDKEAPEAAPAAVAAAAATSTASSASSSSASPPPAAAAAPEPASFEEARRSLAKARESLRSLRLDAVRLRGVVAELREALLPQWPSGADGAGRLAGGGGGAVLGGLSAQEAASGASASASSAAAAPAPADKPSSPPSWSSSLEVLDQALQRILEEFEKRTLELMRMHDLHGAAGVRGDALGGDESEDGAGGEAAPAATTAASASSKVPWLASPLVEHQVESEKRETRRTSLGSEGRTRPPNLAEESALEERERRLEEKGMELERREKNLEKANEALRFQQSRHNEHLATLRSTIEHLSDSCESHTQTIRSLQQAAQEREEERIQGLQRSEENLMAVQENLMAVQDAFKRKALRLSVRIQEKEDEATLQREENRALAAEMERLRERLRWHEATPEALGQLTSESAIDDWERQHREKSEAVYRRFIERRVELRSARVAAEAREGLLCKICFDRPSSCALLPCRHFAFCVPCAERVRGSPEPLCPLCRTRVMEVFETFLG